MKNILILILSLFIISNTFSQVVLTYKNNAPQAGDTIITQEISLISPGNAGPDQVWDFSKLQSNGERNTGFLSAQPIRAIAGLSGFTSTLSDRGYEYFYKCDETGSAVVGENISDLSILFSDPCIRVKYPVLFGSTFTDEFTGLGQDKYKSEIGISGEFSFKADAFGTLILPDRIVKDALRIKTEEKKIQINPCNIYESTTTTYTWYAPAARYPVIGITSREVKTNGKDPVITNSSFLNPEMSNRGILLTVTGQDGAKADDVSLVVYPNPFTEKLFYNYYLRKPMSVTIELIDMTGKTVIALAQDVLQTEGFHTGELDVLKYDLKRGMYSLRFKSGGNLLVSKVVKM